MADLDDFFAKKDKKKAKGKKFLTADQIARKLEETGKKVEKTKKEKEKTTLPSQNVLQEGEEPVHQVEVSLKVEEDEWKEFEEEKKDYSGLKIQNLQLEEGKLEEDDDDDDDEQEVTESGEPVRRTKKAPAGPWKSMNAPPRAETELQEEKTQVEAPPAKSKGSYVAPHMRESQAASTPSSRLKTKTAPDINSEVYFPSLSAATSSEPTGAWGRRGRHGESDSDRGFEEVKNSKLHSSRYAESAKTSGAPSLVLGNKFGALSQNDQS